MLALPACAYPGGPESSLAPRAAEAIDPRVPIETEAPTTPVDAVLAARLDALVAEARAGDAAFAAAAGRAEPLVASAGAPQSESWVVAQQALSQAVAARAPTARAMADIDTLAAEAIARGGGMPRSELEAIESASAEVWRLASNQAARISAMQARLAG